jgi:hypothetical protein
MRRSPFGPLNAFVAGKSMVYHPAANFTPLGKY